MEREKKVIMIIDDDPDDKDIFFEIVSQIDPLYNCVWGKDGVDGIRVLNQLPNLPEYIFLDLNMPRMNGKQCLAEIKQNKKLSGIPVIIYSTSKLESDIQETRKLGASYYMTKPNLFTELREAIHGLLGNSKKPTSYIKRL